MKAHELIVALSFALAVSAACAQREQKVYVVDAIDGDSLQLMREGSGLFRAQLIGVEAPGSREEKRHPSKLNLSSIAFGRWGSARCDPVEKPTEPKKKAPPKPILCRVDVDGRDLSLVQLEAGFASFSTRYSGSLSAAERTSFKEAEQVAKEAKKGMWSDR